VPITRLPVERLLAMGCRRWQGVFSNPDDIFLRKMKIPIIINVLL